MKFLKLSFAIIVLFFTACAPEEASEEDIRIIDSLNNTLAEREAEIENQLQLLDNINAALEEAGRQGELKTNNPEKLKTVDEEIFTKISHLKEKLEKDNAEIKDLRDQLAKAKEKAAYRKALIDKVSKRMEELSKENTLLKQQIERDTQDISYLTAELEDQGIEISKLKKSLKELNNNIVFLTRKLNTAYYVVGTKKELKSGGLISKKGIGGAMTLTENPDLKKYKRIDLSEVTFIRLAGFKKVGLVPARPESSYKFRMSDNTITGLEITDPEKFWKTSHFLAVVVK